MAVSTSLFAPFIKQNTVVLTTYRRDGTSVPTPVTIAVEGNRAFIRTWDTAWKLKRIRRNPRVTVAPSTFKGKVTGPAIVAQARVLSGDESEHAAGLIARKNPILQGVLVPIAHRLRRNTTVHIELTPLNDTSTTAERQAA